MMIINASKKSLLDAYQFDKFRTGKLAKGKFGDKNALMLLLSRRSKKVCALNVAAGTAGGMIARLKSFEIYPAVTAVFILSSRLGVFVAGRLG